jgi:hypothetical protein
MKDTAVILKVCGPVLVILRRRGKFRRVKYFKWHKTSTAEALKHQTLPRLLAGQISTTAALPDFATLADVVNIMNNR